MFPARTSLVLTLFLVVCRTFAQSPNVMYAARWTNEDDLTFGRSFRYHRVNRSADYSVITAKGPSSTGGPSDVHAVLINIDIGGQTYHWEHRGNIPSISDTTIQETFTPDFDFPDSVWTDTPDHQVGKLRLEVSYSFQSTMLTANLLLDVERTAPPQAGHPGPSSNHSSPASGSFVSSDGHSPAVSWATGIVTIVLAAACGVVAVLERVSEHLDTKQPPHRGHGVGEDTIGTIALGVAAQGALAGKALKTNANASHASNEKVDDVRVAEISSHDPGPSLSRMDPIALFLHFQFISTTGLLSLKYPAIYRAFTVNFAWANFILPIQSFIRAAQRSRKCTLSKYPPGISGYAVELGIGPQEVFVVVYCVFLCACLILLGLSLLVGLALQLNVLLATSDEKMEKSLRWRTLWQQMMSNNALRLMHLGLGSLMVFVFWQWTLKCVSPAVVFASVTAFVLVIGSLASVALLIVRLASRPGGTLQLYTKESSYAKRWGTLYSSLDDKRVSFVIPLLTSVVIRSAIIGFGQDSGVAQVIALIILELSMCIGLFRYNPYYSLGYNRVNYMLKGTGVVSHLLLLPFIDQVNLKPSSGRALGIFILTIHSIVAFVLFVLTVLKLGWGVIWYRKKHIAFDAKGREGLPTQ